MLRPAQLYADELKQLYLGVWYDPEYMYYSLSPGMSQYNLDEDNADCHAFASVDQKGNIVGVMSYTVNYSVMQATSLGILAFQRMNPVFMQDLRQCIEDIFIKYNMNRLSFYAVADNPATRGYTKFIERFGGRVVGVEHESCKLIDGKLHDCILYELLAKDFKKKYYEIERSKNLRRLKISNTVSDGSISL